MANHNYGRNRNRSGFHQQWDNGDNINFPTTNVDNRRSGYRMPNRTGEYGNVYNNDRNRSQNWNTMSGSGNYRQGNPRSNYMQEGTYQRGEEFRNDYRDNDWNNRNYAGGEYGYGSRRYNDDEDYENYYAERNWWDRTKDEVSSWFGDDDAERRRRMDEISGEHRGKGPKGYKRSDERIREDVNDRLSDDMNVDASDIEVMVEGSEVTLTGTVKSRWEKRRAEDVAESVSGVKNVENRLRVGVIESASGVQGTGTISTEQDKRFEAGKKSNLGAYQSSKS